LKDGETVKILLVEDSRFRRLINERTLAKAGYDAISAEDGEAALRCAKEQKPDLILLDLLLPRISGLEVLHRLKHNRDTAKIPVVALSGLSERNRQKLLDAGADDYLEKNSVSTDKGDTRPRFSKRSFAASTASAALPSLQSSTRKPSSGRRLNDLVQATGFLCATRS
jgi:CheY-like chemotaxis protein